MSEPITPTVTPTTDAPQPTNSPFHQPVPPRVEQAAEAFQPVRPSAPPPPSDAEWNSWTSAEKQAYARAATAASTAPAPATAAEPKPAGAAGNLGTVQVSALSELAADGSPQLQIGEGGGAIQISQKQLAETIAWKAAEDARHATLPADPRGYELKLPDDLKLPEGVKFAFNEADPILGPQLAAARAFAHENGFNQQQFERMLALHAGAQSQEAVQLKAGREAEIAKLGAAATSRVTSVMTWLKSVAGDDLGKALADNLWTAAQIQAYERIMSKWINGGGGTFNTLHRDVPDAGGISDAKWAKMSYADRADYARSHAQTQPNGRGR